MRYIDSQLRDYVICKLAEPYFRNVTAQSRVITTSQIVCIALCFFFPPLKPTNSVGDAGWKEVYHFLNHSRLKNEHLCKLGKHSSFANGYILHS